MSKRRRDRTPNLPPEAFNAPLANPVKSPSSAAPTRVGASPATGATAATLAPSARKMAMPLAVDWKAEYGEVLRDLGRTFIIFAGLVLAMVVLSFVIR